MKPGKIAQLAAGARQIADMEEPLGRQLSKMKVADGLTLEQVTAPLGVLLIIFESRPDALPQIASLAIRSGNGLLLKGGKEAAKTNAILHKIIVDCMPAYGVARECIVLVEGREAVADILGLHDVVDLVIPRGSNSLVSYISNNTKIPVLGHADGVCHMYLDPNADIAMAAKLAVDSKTDYPAACNALETLLVHKSLIGKGKDGYEAVAAALVAPPGDVRADALEVLLEAAHRGWIDEDRCRVCARSQVARASGSRSVDDRPDKHGRLHFFAATNTEKRFAAPR